MANDAVKKILSDYGLLDEQEEAPKSKRWFIGIAILALLLVPGAYFYQANPKPEVIANSNTMQVAPSQVAPSQLDPSKAREQRAAAAAAFMAEKNPELAAALKDFWNILRERKAALENITGQVSNVLYDNADFRSETWDDRVSTYLAHYTNNDSRFARALARQRVLLDAEVLKSNDPQVRKAYTEMMKELGLL